MGPLVIPLFLGWTAITAMGSLHSWSASGGALAGIVDLFADIPDLSASGVLVVVPHLLKAAVYVALSLLGALGAGAVAMRPWKPGLPHGIGLAAGFAVLSAATAALGFVGLYSPSCLFPLYGVATIAGLVHLAAITTRERLGRAKSSLRDQPVPWLVLASCALLWLFVTTTPGTHEDPLAYHWAAPEFFLEIRKIVATPYNDHWHYPLSHEMLYAPALALDNVAAVKAANLATLVASLSLLGGLARRLIGPAATLWAPAILATAPVLVAHIWVAKNGLGIMLHFLAAATILTATGLRGKPAAALAGAFCGMCASVKYTAIFPIVALLALFIRTKPRAGQWAVFLGFALLAGALWPVRNWLSVGNPVFPFLSSVLGGLWWGPEYEQALRDLTGMVTPAAMKSPEYWLLVWRNFIADPQRLGVLFAALAPLGIAYFLPRHFVLAILAAVASFMVVLQERNIRFLLPVLPLGAIAAAGALAILRERLGRMGGPVMTALLLLTAGDLARGTLTAIPPAGLAWMAGQITADEHGRRYYTSRSEFRRWVNAHIPANARILLAGDQRGFGFVPHIITTHVVVKPPVWRWAEESSTAAQMRKKIRQENISYLAFNLTSGRFRQLSWAGGPPWDRRKLSVYRSVARSYFTEIFRSSRSDYDNGLFYLYRIEDAPRAPEKYIKVLPWTSSIFLPAWHAQRFYRQRMAGRVNDAISLLPYVCSAIEMAGIIYHFSDEWEKGIGYYRELAKAGYDGESNWLHLAAEETKFGNRKRAFSALRKSSRFTPSMESQNNRVLSILLYEWGTGLERQGRKARARECFQMSVWADPSMQPAVDALARIRIRE